jgi:hypothetical protein
VKLKPWRLSTRRPMERRLLADPRFRKRAERRSAVARGANHPQAPACVFLREHGISFHPGRGYSGDAAIPEATPQRGRRSHRRVTEPFRSAYGFGLPGPCRDGVGLSPVSVVSHCVQASPPATLSVRRADPSLALRVEQGEPCSTRLRQAKERGPPTRPKRDPSRTTLAWPLRQRPLPFAAGCVASREGDSSKSFRTGTAPHG